MSVRSKICMALNLHNEKQIISYVEELSDYIGYFKLNSAFTLFGPECIRKIQSYGVKIFLDLKIHYIPNTAAGYAKSVCALGVDIVTIHTAGGSEMMREFANAAKMYEQETGSPRPKCVDVTLLTSIDKQILKKSFRPGD